MTPSPDPLFRNGLENYRKTAPASVWDRVEAGLDRKRRKSVWFRIAAGLCLLMAASTVLWQYDQTDTVETEESVSYQSPVISHQLSAISHQSAPSNNPQSSKLISILERSRNNHADVVHEDLPVVERSINDHLKSGLHSAYGRESAVVSREVTDSQNETQPFSVVKTDDLLETPATDIQIEHSMEESVKDVVLEQKGTSITYTAEQVNSKFIKKDLPAQATQEKKNTSGFQKVIDKARDLTNEGTVYSELREKKNEWLSFNMLSNKTEANK